MRQKLLLLFVALMCFMNSWADEIVTDDQVAANAVVEKISAIGAVEITDACKALVNDARAAYNALSSDQKALVTSAQLKVLTDAEGMFNKNVALKAIVAKTSTYAPIIASFFKDASCVELKDDYKAMTYDEMWEMTVAEGLPEQIQDMILGIKKEWSDEYNSEMSKRFRIQNYNLYPTSAYTKKWQGSLFFDFNGPTGIVADANQLIYVFVGDNVPANTTISLVSCNNAGIVSTTDTLLTNLKKGYNAVVNPRNNAYLWIMFTTTDNSIKVSEQSPIKIHIEGGYAMGYANLVGLSETDAQTEYSTKLEYANNLLTAKSIGKNRVFPVLGNAGEMLFSLSACGQILNNSNIYTSVNNFDELIMAYHNSLGITNATYSDSIKCHTPAFIGADADNAVNNVTSLVLQLGAPDGTEAYFTKVDNVESAYNALTAAQKQMVDPTLATLVQYVASLSHCSKVVEKINAIGTVEFTAASKAKIDTARIAYNALSAEEKVAITQAQLKVLTDAEAEYASLKTAADQAVADVAVGKINAIGTVAYTDASKALIDAARAAYDALTADQKVIVTEAQLKVLTDAETEYAELKVAAEKAAADQAVAEAVVEKINAIGTVAYTDASKALIDAARSAYNALTADQKALVTEAQLKVLNDAETEYAELKVAAEKAAADQAAAEAVVEKIDAIGTVAYTDASKALIDAARSAYDALTADQKVIVIEIQLKVLTDAEAEYERLKGIASGISEMDATGAMKDGKYYVKGKIVIVKAGKFYTIDGRPIK